MRYLLPLLLLILGCAVQYDKPADYLPQSRVDAALAAWTEHGNPIGDCATARPRLQFKTQLELRVYCDADVQIWACVVDDLILIDQEASPRQRTLALEHELRHLLSSCSVGSTDYHHFRDRAWYPHPETGENVRTTESWN